MVTENTKAILRYVKIVQQDIYAQNQGIVLRQYEKDVMFKR